MNGDELTVDNEAFNTVTRYLMDTRTRHALEQAGVRNGVGIVAVSAEETIYRVQLKMNSMDTRQILLGVYYPTRSPHTRIPQWRQVQTVICEKRKLADGKDGFEMFDDISPDATIGMYCDYLWRKPGRTVGVPDFAGKHSAAMLVPAR